jgi:phosphate:Na+ symporter
MLATVLGGVGLFLLGMLLMTEGLKAIAGQALNRVLSRFTRTPFIGMLTGAGITALVQSSSVTTLAVIGFVSAGMLTFPQTLGLIFGMNLGTTSTAWIVSLIGFKVNIATMALPLVAIGTFLKLSSSGKAINYGSVVAGFGLIFIGISTMQNGMAELSTSYDPSQFPGGNFLGNLLLLLVGVGMTIIMQSSSAAVATTLAALFSNAITLDQAAVLVIGQNIGTTVTAALAAIGASVAAKRVAAAHISFNILTGIVAFILLPVLVQGMIYLRESFNWTEASTLAAFHSFFNLLGVAIIFPFTVPFTNRIIKLLPEVGPQMTHHLNPKVIKIASAAIEAARQATIDIANVLIEVAHGQLSGQIRHRTAMERLGAANLALAETRRFLGSVRPEQGGDINQQHHVSIFHAIDHLSQLSEALEEFEVAKNVPNAESCRNVCMDLVNTFSEVLPMISRNELNQAAELLGQKSLSIADVRRNQRRVILEKTAALGLDPDAALDELEAMRWADRLAYHIWRATYHLQEQKPIEDMEEAEVKKSKEKVKEKDKEKKKKKKKKEKERVKSLTTE